MLRSKLHFMYALCNCILLRAREICSQTSSAIQLEIGSKCQFWEMELNSGGNVKLSTCDPSQPCFISCSELVNSRFSVADIESFGISGLEITEVVRVENRLLFNWSVVTSYGRLLFSHANLYPLFTCSFNDKLKTLLAVEPYLSMTASQLNKKMVDYLFLVWQPGITTKLLNCTYH